MNELHPLVPKTLQYHQARVRDNVSSGELPNFETDNCDFATRNDITAGEKLCLMWRGRDES